MTPAPTSRRDRPAKAPLSREAIVATGLRILDRDGLDALTMRRVAHELDTGPASLYVYVHNREDLMAAMLDQALGQALDQATDQALDQAPDQAGNPAEGTWRDHLRDLVAAAVAAVSRHEGLALAALGHIPTGANALLIIDRMLALLKDGGLDDATAAWAVDLIHLHIIATAAEQSAYNAKDAVETEHLDAVARHFSALDPARYPMVTSLRGALLAGGDRDTWGVNVLINGILHTPVEREQPADR